MKAAFEAGARDSIEKTAAGKSPGKVLDWALSQPEALGAIIGAAMGWGTSPSDNRMQNIVPGALIGAGLGHLTRGGRKIPVAGVTP